MAFWTKCEPSNATDPAVREEFEIRLPVAEVGAALGAELQEGGRLVLGIQKNRRRRQLLPKSSMVFSYQCIDYGNARDDMPAGNALYILVELHDNTASRPGCDIRQ